MRLTALVHSVEGESFFTVIHNKRKMYFYLQKNLIKKFYKYLTPGAYVGVAEVEDDGVDFAQRMGEIHRELLKLQAESNDLMQTISKNMKEMGL